MLPANTPLYSHPLPQIEQWLKNQGCQQDDTQLHCWRIQRSSWEAELWLDTEQITVRYLHAGENSSVEKILKKLFSLDHKLCNS
jgi:hypothetical protein